MTKFLLKVSIDRLYFSKHNLNRHNIGNNDKNLHWKYAYRWLRQRMTTTSLFLVCNHNNKKKMYVWNHNSPRISACTHFEWAPAISVVLCMLTLKVFNVIHKLAPSFITCAVLFGEVIWYSQVITYIFKLFLFCFINSHIREISQ